MNTTYFLQVVAGNVFKTDTSIPLPDEYYLGLSKTAPAADGSNVTEPAAADGYARVKLTSLSAPVNGFVSNEALVSFDESTANWGTVTHYVIFDSLTGGKLLIYGELSTSRNVEADTIMTVKDGYLRLGVQNPAAA